MITYKTYQPETKQPEGGSNGVGMLYTYKD
jgi:hypothetical protein